jgi:hypothetical protein
MRWIELPIPCEDWTGAPSVRWETLELATADDVRHARYLLACLHLAQTTVYSDDDDDGAMMLCRDGPAPFTPAPATQTTQTTSGDVDDVLPF